MKLIDFDASANFKEGEYVGLKYSSACLPPEMFWKDTAGVVKVRSVQHWSPDAGYDLLLASPSYDMWSFGCLLYFLCTGTTLFQCRVSDDSLLFEKDVVELWEWTEATKRSKLGQVKNRLAKNLLSLLLTKNPQYRLDPSHVLSHPFLTGIAGSRLQGREPKWDVFLSYRVDSDSGHVAELYQALMDEGLTVWWDKHCLQPGQNWEEGFCSGLVSSRCFVCLLSRGAIKNSNKDWQNLEKQMEKSKCDNVLLEWRLALELQERAMIEGIFPVMIGDKGSNGEYSDYFVNNCGPNPPDIVVESLEAKLHEHLEREGLGCPYNERVTVKSLYSTIVACQGGFYRGQKDVFSREVVTHILDMVNICKMTSLCLSSAKIQTI